MTRWSKVKPIARFELVSTVRSKGWLIATFGMPVFLLLYGGFVSIFVFMEARKQSQVAVYGVVDDAGFLALDDETEVAPVEIPAEVRMALEAAGQADVLRERISLFQNYVFRPFPTDDAARAALLGGAIRGYYRVPPDYVRTGVVERFTAETASLNRGESRRALGRLLTERLVHGTVPDDVVARIREPIADTRDWTVTRAGEVKPAEAAARVARVIVPIAFAVLILISIMMGAGGLIQATAIEKENKVVEVLLSSANPDEILMGKLAGQGIAGTAQMAVWFGMAGVAGLAFTTMLATLGVEPPWLAMVAAVVFYPLAYLFYGSLALGTGSIGANQKEANQWGMAGMLVAAIPMFFLQTLVDEPNGVVGRVLTWIPFAAPTTVVFRLSIDPGGVRWWEVLGAIVVMLVSIYCTVRLSARLFRVGIMLTGARPKLREILRQARLETGGRSRAR